MAAVVSLEHLAPCLCLSPQRGASGAVPGVGKQARESSPRLCVLTAAAVRRNQLYWQTNYD